ncbi:MAG TPA: class I SAM-dependent methyltransferase [Kofleriaceae bacterium]|jgi:O-methyltransferase involved in polyketide biosynthesis|nr:class I SAM-dependent methyltransferase [Kofleriaceae bacterium]
MARPHPETISPTAHYTGYVWVEHGLSHEAFATRTGRVMYYALRGANLLAHHAGKPSLEGLLLARHQLIDLRLAQAIDAGEIQQVVEIAAGLSPRGWRFARRYGDRITYVEADLPGMLAHKRRILASLGGETAHHRTAEVDALADIGPTSVAAICGALDPSRGTAIITEGLLNYFDHDVMIGMWHRFAAALRRFPHNRYLADLLVGNVTRSPIATGFGWLLSAFVRGKVHMPFETPEAARESLEHAGLFGSLLDPREFAGELDELEPAGASWIRVIEAIARHDGHAT